MKNVLCLMNGSFLSYLRTPLYTNKHYATQQFVNELRHEHDIMHKNGKGYWHVTLNRLQFYSTVLRNFIPILRVEIIHVEGSQ